MFMVLSSWQSHYDSSPSSFYECRTAPSGRPPKTKADDLGCESACTGCKSLHPPSSFIIITQPECWYSFYRSTESRRLSRPSWLVTYRDGLPAHRRSPILVPTGSDVAQLYVDLGQRQTATDNRTWGLMAVPEKNRTPGGQHSKTYHHLCRKYGYETTPKGQDFHILWYRPPRIWATQLTPTFPESWLHDFCCTI